MNKKKMNPSYWIAPLMVLSFLGTSANVYCHESKMTQSDTDLARKIHQDLASDSALSAYAQNIKVIALDGKVILKGKVSTMSERQSVIDRVTAESGVSKVVNKLDIKTADTD